MAYKGGHVEKDWLTKLNIPHVDLEFFDCPKANPLLLKGFQPILDCGYHMHTIHILTALNWNGFCIGSG